MTKSMEIRVRDTPIDGLFIVDLPLHTDERGWFKENWQREKMMAAGLPDFRPVQNNVSYNQLRGTTRGLHAEPWDKYLSVVHGEVFGAWVDLRSGPSFGTSFHARIGEGQAVFVPRGVSNGFQTLVDHTVYSYLVTEHWAATSRRNYSYLNLSDPTVRIPWPIAIEHAIVSDADKAHPFLAQTQQIEPKRIVVIGGSGQLGRAFAEIVVDDPRITILTRNDVDLLDPDFAQNLDLSQCSHVVNAAAMTHVDQAETSSGRVEAWQINGNAVMQLSKQCAARGVVLIHVSTDYVFDGSNRDVTEEQPVAPLGVYGQSKAAGEYAALAHPDNFVVRTSWVVGDGSNFIETMRRLASQNVSPEVVCDQVGRITFASELATAILFLIDKRCAPGIYHLQGNGIKKSWFELAQQVFQICGRNTDDIRSISGTEYSSGRSPMAPRPLNSTFDMAKMRSVGFRWHSEQRMLEEYLSKRPCAGP